MVEVWQYFLRRSREGGKLIQNRQWLAWSRTYLFAALLVCVCVCVCVRVGGGKDRVKGPLWLLRSDTNQGTHLLLEDIAQETQGLWLLTGKFGT